MSAPDAIVIGAGIVGAACARQLATEGMRVLVLEREFAAAGATAAAMGHLVVMDDSPAQLALTRLSVGLWTALAEELPPAVEDLPSGTLWVAADDEELGHAAARCALLREAGVRAEMLSSEELLLAEPRLTPGLAGGLRVPGDRVVYPPAAARWLLERAMERGAEAVEGITVKGVGEGAVETRERGRIEAPIVICAAGAHTPDLLPSLPIEPRKGHLLITDRAPGFCHHQLIELGYLKSAHTMTAESVAFNVQPRATGQLLIGSSRELVGWDASINRPLLARMLARAIRYLPGLASLSAIRSWVGFRPATPDHLPLIGHWPLLSGLWVAAGHEGLGITTALGTAGLLADLIAGRPPGIDAGPFDPARFLTGAES